MACRGLNKRETRACASTWNYAFQAGQTLPALRQLILQVMRCLISINSQKLKSRRPYIVAANVSAANAIILGEGSVGCVYKCILPG
ncbi:hypothetical protein Sjap_008697 [Stephania japonica]|uniref:Uncharacterized protein n=1 Tax=Stephania japonica TaxID=461633 RepID=A0AAP0JQ05_9MAGN